MGLGMKNQEIPAMEITYLLLLLQDSYTMPLTSIQCWHVHCEECWLRTLVRLLATFLLTNRLLPFFWDTLF